MNDLLHKRIVDTFFKESTGAVGEKKKPKKNKEIFTIVISILFSIFLISGLLISRNYIKGDAVKTDKKPKGTFRQKPIFSNGRLDYSRIKRVYFSGDAKDKSCLLDFSLKLVNAGNSGRADFNIMFKMPLDFSGKSLSISLRTESGEKNIKLTLKDSDMRLYDVSDIRSFSSWAKKSFYLNQKNNFDLERVKSIKLAFGTEDAGNAENSVIYIKDIDLSD